MAQDVATVPTRVMQGIAVPATSVDPPTFFRLTRRNAVPLGRRAVAFGTTQNIGVLQAGIVSELTLRITGTVTVTLGGGTCASTALWPYGILRAARFAANGQSNLISANGPFLKAREITALGDLSDRGVAQGIGGASPGTARTQGTLALASEAWGIGQNVTAIPGAPTVYTVDILIPIPIAYDQRTLIGALFAQTSATDLTLFMDWAAQADLFTLTGAATVALDLNAEIEAISYSIPQGPNGDVIVPDLSAFHSFTQSRASETPAAGAENVHKLAGQGIGRQLFKILFRVMNGAAPGAPLAVTDTNFGTVGWRYGNNETPELYATARHLRYKAERLFNSDLGDTQGMHVLDFGSEFAVRDSIDEGTASELRFFYGIPSGVVLTTPYCEYAQDTIFAGASG